MKVLSKLFLLSVLVLAYQPAWSQVHLKKTQKLIMPADVSNPFMSAETSQKIQPRSVGNGASASAIASQIVDNSFSLWWDTSPIRNTQVGRAAEKVEKSMKTEVSYKTNRVEHKISFKVLAMQALAKLEYKGWVNAAINYDARADKTEAEVSEKISAEQDVIISHAFTPGGNKSQVAWRWNW